MGTASLLCNIFNDVYQHDSKEYCMICFRSLEERRLVDGENLMKFKYFRQSNRLKSKDNTRYEKSLSENCLVCYVCDRQAAAAVKFCIAVNLSNKLHYMFSKMKLNGTYRKDIFTLLAWKEGRQVPATEHDKEAKESEAVFNQLRQINNLLQTETLTLGNDVNKADPLSRRGAMRDLFTFETNPVSEDDPLAEFTELTSQPDLMTKTILLDDDDNSNDEPHPIAIIHNAINNRETDEQTDRQTMVTQQNLQNMIQNQTGMVLQPVIFNINENNQNFALNGNNLTQNQFALNNGTLTSINGQNFIINNPIGGNISMPIILNKDQLIPINNLNVNNQFILPNQSVLVPQNQNNVILAQKQMSQTQNNSLTMAQKQNNSVIMAQNQNNSIIMSQNHNMNTTNLNSDTKMAQLVALKRTIDKKFQGSQENSRKTQESVKMPTLVALKRPPDMKCQETVNSPTPVKSGKIDWEDQIPMDVISCVSNTDPSVKPQSNPTPGQTNTNYTTDVSYKDPIDIFVITDVKSISEMPQQDDVIDLC